MTAVLSNFSKGIKESCGLSFSLSAGNHCDNSCAAKKKGFCYAEKVEGRYKNYGIKLEKHQKIKPHILVYAAVQELKNKKTPISFMRISVSGSVPARKDISKKDFNDFKTSLEYLAKYLNSIGASLHFPVETAGKARTYRKILEPFGITVRRTAQTKNFLGSKDDFAYVVQKEDDPKEVLKTARENGLKAIICPAIISDSKCGKCTFCATGINGGSVVLYPQHN